MSKRITLSVRIPVSITVDADLCNGEVTITSVVGINGPPSAWEVIEALDANDGLADLDDAFENAPGEQS